ncbi:NACHT and WD repeat domain-containing protein [Propionicicella superfundia]|uniref:NACHT and WD repeat domain-containing protein n=1 Tax=Propionicicella superfundia TaxID=348582 RepID=UPI0004023305|nr:NACHT and WD repeat domain-containing protein [Propionicicella superfundia]
MSVRAFARIADVPPATAQGWLSGKHFPTPALRPNFLRAVEHFDLTSELSDELWDESWEALEPALRNEHTPYLGLRSFTVDDSAYFHGRRADSARLALAVSRLREAEGHGVVVLVGPSGSGKSSLLAAGLVAGECTTGALAGTSAVIRRADAPNAADAPTDLVVVDQAEDLIDDFDAMARLSSVAAKTVVVLGIRADAFPRAMHEAALRDALSRPVLISPLTREELREVIVTPAQLDGVEVEDALVRILVAELAPRSGDTVTPDVLPLLSSALLATWAAGSGRAMTLADYEAAGGVAAAVDTLAERAFLSLSVADQGIAQTLFLRLVAITNGTPTRRTVRLSGISEEIRTPLETFVAARMITVSEDAASISHDALLEHWSRLRGWVEVGRADLNTAVTLRRAAQVWEDSDRDPDALIPVHRLGIFSTWLDDPAKRALLTAPEVEYLIASEERFSNELATAKQTNMKLRFRQQLAITLASLATILALITGLLWIRGSHLETEATQARNEALSRQVALTASSLRAKDPNLQAQMSIIARGIADTTEARSALLTATASDAPIRWTGRPSAVVAASPDGATVARGDGAGQITIWHGEELTTTPGTTTKVSDSADPIFTVALAVVGGRTVLAVGGTGIRQLWDVTDEPTRLADLHTETITRSVAFTPAGDAVAFGGEDGVVTMYDLANPQHPAVAHRLTLATASSDPAAEPVQPSIGALAIDRDGVLYAGGVTGSLARWRISPTPERLADLPTISRDATGSERPLLVQAIAVSPDGRRLAAGGTGPAVLRWTLEPGGLTEETSLTSFTSYINALAFSADNSQLAVASSDQTLSVFDADSGQARRTIANPAIMTGVVIVGGRPVGVGTDGTLRVWSTVSPGVILPSSGYNLAVSDRWVAVGTGRDGIYLLDLAHQRRVMPSPKTAAGDTPSYAVALTPDGTRLLGGTTDGKLVSWKLTDQGAVEPRITETGIGTIGNLALSPDGSMVVAIEYNGTKSTLLRLEDDGGMTRLATLDTTRPQAPCFVSDSLLAIPLSAGKVQLFSLDDPTDPRVAGTIEGLNVPMFTSAGHDSPLIAIGEDSGTVTIWDVSDPAVPRLTHTYTSPHATVYGLSFSLDDRRVIAATGDDRVWIWNTDADASSPEYIIDPGIGRPWDARYLADGHFVVTGVQGVKFYLASETLAKTSLCQTRGEPLTDEESERFLPGVPRQDPC